MQKMDQEIRKAVQDSSANIVHLIEQVAQRLQNEIREFRSELRTHPPP